MKKYTLFLILMFLTCINVIKVKSQSWTNLGCTIDGGTRALVVNGNNIYSIGTFSDKVMMYDFTQGCTGLGFPGSLVEIRGMAFYNGELYVAGLPDILADTGRVYRLSNGTWSAMATYDGYVNCMTVYNGSLYIGGGLSSVSGVFVSNVARWDGIQWSNPGGGIPFNGMTQVRTMEVYNNLLIVGGNGFAPFANDIASWNGTNWNTLSSGITGGFNTGVYGLTSHNGDLYVGGHFSTAGGQPAANIAKWNGTTWSPLGSGISGGDTLVIALASYFGSLYVGGTFSEAGGVPAANVAVWNGSNWNSVGTGFPGSVITALTVYYGSLIAAGPYNNPTSYYAVWQSCPAIINATGPTTVCTTTVPLTATSGSSYQWHKNGSAIFGATSQTYLAPTSGNYMCLVSNPCGPVFSNTISVTVNPSPSAVITPGGSTTFCAQGSVILQANIGIGLSYTWYKFGNLIPGATSSSYVASTNGKYKVQVTNNFGCSKKSPAVTVTVNPLPNASITAASSTSICAGDSVMLNVTTNNPGSTFQWKRYSNLIAGATTTSYAAKVTGNYKCLVTSPAGCVRASNGIVVTVVCREGIFAEESFDVYPNPFNDKLNITNGEYNVKQLTLFNPIGAEIYNEEINSENNFIEMDFATLPSGIYLLKITTDTGQVVRRVVKE